MPKHAKKSDHLQLLDPPKTTMVEVPLPLLGAFANIDHSRLQRFSGGCPRFS